jgi:hypothetical protein
MFKVAASQAQVAASRGYALDQSLVLEYLRSAVHRGSDVRLDAGDLMRPSAYPRRAIVPDSWNWCVVLKFRWDWASHISILEARAVRAMLRWRLRKKSALHTPILHLMDSFVAIAVLAKGRSSSHILNSVARHVSALALASFTYPVYGFVASAKNPSDEPTRSDAL